MNLNDIARTILEINGINKLQGQLNTQQYPLIEAIIRKQLVLPSQTPNEKIQKTVLKNSLL